MADKKFEVEGVSIVTTGKKTVVKEDFEKVLDQPIATADPGAGKTIEEMYDEFSRLIYVIDASGSMGEGIVQTQAQLQYNWTPQMEKDAREFLLELIDAGESILDPIAGVDLTVAQIKGLDRNALTQIFTENSWEGEIGLYAQPKANTGYRQGRSKMMAVKDAAKDFVRQRFQKFPNARVCVYSFEGAPSMLVNGAAESNVLDAIDSLPDMGGSSTDIYKAVNRAVSDCQKARQQMGAHHIVLVSDGMDDGGRNVKNLTQTMLQMGIVFDFIFIAGTTPIDGMQYVIDILKGVCEATGGEFTTVRTEKDFSQKFLAASSRLCLPPAPKQLK